MTLSHEELKSLLAASALNALPSDEADQLDRHLQRCSHCRAELVEFEASASLLAGPSLPPPEGLWEEISRTIGQPAGEEMPVSLRRVVRRRNKFIQGWTFLATGAVAAAIVLAVWGVGLHGQVNRLKSASISSQLQTAVSSALASPDRHLVDLRATGGNQVAQAVITTNGTAFLVAKSLPALSAGQTYQLWANSAGKAVSLGVLGQNPAVTVFRFEPHMTELMLTAEPSGGVPAPTTPVIASGAIST
jgi:anti-sigma factor RsiW